MLKILSEMFIRSRSLIYYLLVIEKKSNNLNPGLMKLKKHKTHTFSVCSNSKNSVLDFAFLLYISARLCKTHEFSIIRPSTDPQYRLPVLRTLKFDDIRFWSTRQLWVLEVIDFQSYIFGCTTFCSIAIRIWSIRFILIGTWNC